MGIVDSSVGIRAVTYRYDTCRPRPRNGARIEGYRRGDLARARVKPSFRHGAKDSAIGADRVYSTKNSDSTDTVVGTGQQGNLAGHLCRSITTMCHSATRVSKIFSKASSS